MGNRPTDSYREEEIERAAIGLATDALLEALRFHHDHNLSPPKNWKAPKIPAPVRPDRFAMDNIAEGPKIRDIQWAVADYFKVDPIDLLSARRTANLVKPRQIGYYLCKRLTLKSLPEIGRRFGRDHTTILHGVRVIEWLRKTDPQMIADTNAIASSLGHHLEVA